MGRFIRIGLVFVMLLMCLYLGVYQSKIANEYEKMTLVANEYGVEFEVLDFLMINPSDTDSLREEIMISAVGFIEELEVVNLELAEYGLSEQISENKLVITELKNLEVGAVDKYEESLNKSLESIELKKQELKALEEKEKSDLTANMECDYEVDGVIIVNKQHCLSEDYISPLADEASLMVDELIASASSEGLSFKLLSGYRSYEEQISTYNYWKDLNGEVEADKLSARPGFSEHQTGLAYDLGNLADECSLQACFGTTKEGEWLKVNAHRFGFVIRYMEGKDYITGYNYEPWHLRYLGVDLATEVYESGLTLEEYFDLV